MLIKKISIIILFLFWGCNDLFVNDKETVDYSIDQVLSCFCFNRGKAVKLYVQADSIVDAIYITSKIHVPQNEWKRYRTIKGLFNEITKWDTSAYTVEISYDPIYNYPSYIYVNPKPVIINDTIVQVIADADFSFRTSNYIKYK